MPPFGKDGQLLALVSNIPHQKARGLIPAQMLANSASASVSYPCSVFDNTDL